MSWYRNNQCEGENKKVLIKAVEEIEKVEKRIRDT